MTTLADALSGAATFAWVELPRDVSAAGLVGREVMLDRLGHAVVVTYVRADGSERSRPANGRSDGDEKVLQATVAENGHVVAFVDDVDERQPPHRWVRLRMHEITGRFDWGELRIGADEAALNSARRIGGIMWSRDPGKVLDWLRGRLSFTEAPGRPSPLSMPGAALPSSVRPRRMLAVVPPGQDMAAPVSCKLIGHGIVATLFQDRDGSWWLRQVHQERRARRDYERCALIHARLNIFNATVRATLKRKMQEELARLGSGESEQTFVAMWRRYHEMENRYALRRMIDLGFVEYTSWSYLDDADDVVRFQIAPGRDELLIRLHEDVRAGNETELECVVQLPELLGGSGKIDPAAGLLDLKPAKGSHVGAVVGASLDPRVVDMQMVPQSGDTAGPVRPEGRGFLHAAIRGDHRRLQRRNNALERLLAGRIQLPQLLSLLQGEPARGKEHRPVAALSAAAEACFARSNPNPEQQLALDIALNTPDVAVIQGPPGTGKTQLIAALQVRLAEEGRGYASVSHSMLLTSYQHAAVDNMVERSMVWNLPAVKIDSRNRGSTAHIEEWRRTTIQALHAELGSIPDGRRTLAIREVARQAAEYCLAPWSTEELVRRLDDITAVVIGLVSDELLSRLNGIVATLRTQGKVARFQADARRESALRAVRGIRCEPIAFEDDGPLMAESALHHLDRLSVVDDLHRELLTRAADWAGDHPPPFLAALTKVRDELLDWLTDRADALFRPAPREDVVNVLNEIVDDLDQQRRTTFEGVHAALVEYLEELDGDPEAVLATLRLYTASLATTCQQADSIAVRDIKDGERLFDTVIVDEAARANPLDLLIPLTLAARRVILVGDQNQLPHMLEPDVEQELRSDSDDVLVALRESLFGRLFALLHSGDTTPGRKRAVRLREQYRMHPVLGRFIGRNFYQGNLDSPRPAEDFSHGLDGYLDRPAAWLRVPRQAGGEHGGQSKSRTIEAKAIAAELRRHIRARPDLTFGVISFYSAQVQLVWEQLVDARLAERGRSGYQPVEELRRDADGAERERLQVGTVDAFQGKQFDVVLLSLTRSSRMPPSDQLDPAIADPAHPDHARYEQWARRTYGHLMLVNRLCVAMSRQERLLVVVGDDAMVTSPLTPASVRPLSDFHRLCSPPSTSGVLLTSTARI